MNSPHRRAYTAPGGSSGGWAGASGSGTGGGGLSRTHSLALSSPGGRLQSRNSSALTAAEEASLAAVQELASVMNAPPPAAGSASWLAAWSFTQAFSQEDYDAPPPLLPPGTLPEVQLSDFARYLRNVGDRLETLERSKEASQQRMQNALSPEELRASQGQGLVAAMREVPAAFFQEGFDLDQKQLWEELVQVESEEARQESLERLSGYLDVVETHLVREIAARTDNFFDASGYIQDVRGSVARLYQQVAALRKQMHSLEQETAVAVNTSRQLQRQRANLTAALDLLRAVEAAAQAQSALQGLLPSSGGGGGAGVAVDYAGAIDVLEVLQGLLDDEALLALDCFQHLPGQIVETAQAVDDLMTSDFLERSRFAAVEGLAAGILDRLRAQVAAQEAATPPGVRRRRTSSQTGGGSGAGLPAWLAPSRKLSAEESAELAGLAGLRLQDGAAVDRVVRWLERGCCCGSGSSAGGSWAGASAAAAAPGGGQGYASSSLGPNGSWDGEGEGGEEESLQEVLLPLVMGLRRMGRLSASMKELKARSAAGLKDLLSRVIEGCLDVLDPESAPGDSSHLLASHRSLSPGRERGQDQGQERESAGAVLAGRLARLPGQDFQWVLEAGLLASKAYLNHCTAVGEAVQTILTAANAPKQQLSVAGSDARECCQAAAEAAAARWSKLLSGRARSSTESGDFGAAGFIRLAELQGVLELTDTLAAQVEGYGVRGVLGLRSALQQLCKASLDGLHSKSLSELTTLLEQEQWTAVDVPPQFQEIAEQLEARGAGAGAEGAVGLAGGAGTTGGHAAAAAEGNVGGSSAQLGGTSGADGGGEESVLRKFTITPPDQQPNGSGPAPVLRAGGRPYHVVNTQLLLLSMLRDYLAFRDAVPAFGAEVAQRVLELLKVFNSRTCQLVLGAGAMQVSGLKSITAKHLALSCQCLGAFMALHPALVAAFTQGLQPPRRDMLVADFGRALQDYRIHHEEVCTKLVAIMRERLSANIKQLPALATGWPAGGLRGLGGTGRSGGHLGAEPDMELEAPPPSGFAVTAAKQLQILCGALSPLLLPEELHSIFGRIGRMFSATLAEAYELLEPHGAAWEQQLRADMQFLLNCLRNLPMDPAERDSNLEQLTALYERRFLLASSPAAPPLHEQPPAPPAAPPAAPQAHAQQQAPQKVQSQADAQPASSGPEEGPEQAAAVAAVPAQMVHAAVGAGAVVQAVTILPEAAELPVSGTTVEAAEAAGSGAPAVAAAEAPPLLPETPAPASGPLDAAAAPAAQPVEGHGSGQDMEAPFQPILVAQQGGAEGQQEAQPEAVQVPPPQQQQAEQQEPQEVQAEQPGEDLQPAAGLGGTEVQQQGSQEEQEEQAQGLAAAPVAGGSGGSGDPP